MTKRSNDCASLRYRLTSDDKEREAPPLKQCKLHTHTLGKFTCCTQEFWALVSEKI